MYNYKKANWEKFVIEINSIKWEEKLQDKSCENMWKTFRSTLTNIQNRHIPFKKLRKKPFLTNLDE